MQQFRFNELVIGLSLLFPRKLREGKPNEAGWCRRLIDSAAKLHNYCTHSQGEINDSTYCVFFKFDSGSVNFFNRFQNVNIVQNRMGEWVPAIWMFRFRNPLVVKKNWFLVKMMHFLINVVLTS